VHIQLFWILHICNIQYILRWNAIYFLCEKRHLHGLFGCWSFRNWRHLSHFCCNKQYKTNLHCLKWRLFRKLQQPKGPWRWRFSQINRRTRRTTRSTSSNRLKYVIPKCRTTTYQKSFLVSACRVWNYLADELNLTKDTSITVFKSDLLKYYFTSLNINYDPENSRTFKSICLKCNCIRSLLRPISCCSWTENKITCMCIYMCNDSFVLGPQWLAIRCCGRPAVVMYCISLCTFVFVLLCNVLFHRQSL
jgi:hypothetical protein